jgi:hypothetical protein
MYLEFEIRKAHTYFSKLLQEKGLHPSIKVEDEEWLVHDTGIMVCIGDTEERMKYEVATATQ